MFGLRFAEEVAILRIENDGLNAKLAEANRIKGLQAQDIEVLRREADSAKERYARIREENEQLRAERDQAQALLAEAREANGQQARDIVALFKEIEEYRKSVDMLTKDLDAAKAGWTKASKEVLRLTNQTEEQKKEILDLECAVKTARGSVTVLEHELSEAYDQRNKAQAEVEAMKAKFADRREKHTIEANALVAERNTAQAEAAELHEKLHTLEEKYRHLDATLGKVQTERDIAENNVVVLERRLKEVAAERDSAIEAHSGICAHLEQREAKMDELKKAFEAVKAERDQAKEALAGAIEDTTYWRHCYEKAVADKGETDWHKRFEDANHLAEGWHQEACELRGQLTAKDAEIASLTGELVQTQADYKDKCSDYDAVRRAYTELESHMKKVQANAVAPMQPAEVTHREDLHHATDPVEVAGRLYTLLSGYATQALACQPIDVERLQAVNEAKWLVVELLNRLTKPL